MPSLEGTGSSGFHEQDLDLERSPLAGPTALGIPMPPPHPAAAAGPLQDDELVVPAGPRRDLLPAFPGSALGLRFECDLRNGLAREVFFTGCYEPPETMLIRRLVDPGGAFVDVGAHWGYFSLVMAEHVGADGPGSGD